MAAGWLPYLRLCTWVGTRSGMAAVCKACMDTGLVDMCKTMPNYNVLLNLKPTQLNMGGGREPCPKVDNENKLITPLHFMTESNKLPNI